MFRLKAFQTNKYNFVINDHLARSFVESRCLSWMSRFFNFNITYFYCNEITGGIGLEPNLVYMFSAAFSLFDKLTKIIFIKVTRKSQQWYQSHLTNQSRLILL
ncbi:hypothetical protein Hanom_Chr00s000002g01599431 [Helianthus anomalus]